jgi:hypothetical protein
LFDRSGRHLSRRQRRDQKTGCLGVPASPEDYAASLAKAGLPKAARIISGLV